AGECFVHMSVCYHRQLETERRSGNSSPTEAGGFLAAHSMSDVSTSLGFGPAAEDEPTVFGASRPGYPSRSVPDAEIDAWLAFMTAHSIQRVVCLLPPEQLKYYVDLRGRYVRHFGADRTLFAPIPDFCVADRATLTDAILPFLTDADQRGERTVVHCSAGIGR